MPVLRLMYRFRNWFGKREETLLAPDHVPVTQWLEESLNNSQDDQEREFHPERTGRNSLILRRLSMVITRVDKDPKNEDCRCLTSDMCPNGTSDPVPCAIHAVGRS